MTVRVALLRGINVGGHKKIPMAALRELATELGFENPKSYVQSGNLVFVTKRSEASTVGALQEGLVSRLGFEVPVISRTADEIQEIASNHPFSDLGIDDRLLQVAFLDRIPSQAIVEVIDADEFSPDRFEGKGREVYLAYPNGSGRSKLDHSLLERRLGVSVTSRNWRTVSKLAEMAASL